jgi:arylsulfatase A-like enzyme
MKEKARGRARMRRGLLPVVTGILAALLSVACVPELAQVTKPPPAHPNYLVIVTDDMSTDQLKRMPGVQKNLVRPGREFENAFVTSPQCCPSRASYLTGKYVHNHGVLDTSPAFAANYFHRSGQDRETINVALDSAGYETMLVGKWLNHYSGKYVPPGWDRWRGQIGKNNDHRYNINGKNRYFDPAKYNDTDLFSGWSDTFLKNRDRSKPFFLYVGVNPPHSGAAVPGRHADAFRNADLPKPPNFNERDVSDKPAYASKKEDRIDRRRSAALTKEYRERARSLLAVDDMVNRLVGTLKATGELDETYIVFTSDHGYHLGQHRFFPGGKTRPYEEDLSVPFVVRGPDVPAGANDDLIINSDLAPTMADLSGVTLPEADGRSAAPLWRGATPASWRQRFLIEFYFGNEWKGYRSATEKYIENESGEKELYDLAQDPYELKNRYEDASAQDKQEAVATLDALEDCSGDSCRAAEEND